MGNRDSDARGRELGGELREVRLAKNLKMLDIAKATGWSESKVSRLEAGMRGTTELDVAVFLTVCGVKQGEFDRIIELAKKTSDSYWLRPHEQELQEELRSLIVQETTAMAVISYEPHLVPGLLQTERYLRTLFHQDSTIPEDAIERRVQARLTRQGLLRRQNPPHCTFFIHEHALRLSVDHPTVMNDQLLHLVFASSRPQCTIRVVPASTKFFGSVGCAFRLMTYAGHPPVVYVPTETLGLFLENREHIARYRELLGKLDEAAFGVGESRQWLATLASEYDRAETYPDERADLAEKQLQRR